MRFVSARKAKEKAELREEVGILGEAL